MYNEAMRVTWRMTAVMLVMAASLVLLVWGFWPPDREQRFIALAPVNLTPPLEPPVSVPVLATPDGGIQPTPDPKPATMERRRITLEFPPRIRSGDADVIRLTLEVTDPGGLTPTTQFSGDKVTGDTVEIPNLYETHNIIAEARLDMAGLEIRPQELISSPISPGQPVNFYWSVQPQEGGKYKGTVWLFVRFVNKVTGEQSQRAVSAQVIEIQSTTLFGLSADFARTTGAIGSIVGGIVGFPFLEDILRYLSRRRRVQ